jgi:hypothetical protein
MLNSIKWFATITSIIGAFMVAQNFQVFWGYVFFTLGSGSWLFVAYRIKDRPLFLLNLVFTLADFVGLYTYF